LCIYFSVLWRLLTVAKRPFGLARVRYRGLMKNTQQFHQLFLEGYL